MDGVTVQPRRAGDRSLARSAETMEIRELRETVERQEAIISALVEAAERPRDAATRLGVRYAADHRMAKANQTERVLRSVIESLDGALCIVGRDGTVLDANSAWLRSRPAPVTPRIPRPGSPGTDFFAWCRAATHLGDLAGRIADLVTEVLSTEPESEADAGPAPRARDRSAKGRIPTHGELRWVVVRVHSIRNHASARAVVSIIDITDGMRTQDQLRQATEEAQRLALVARATDNGVVITLPDGSIEWANGPFVRRTGYPLDEIVGTPRLRLMRCEGDPPEFAEFSARVEKAMTADGEFLLVDRHGRRYWASVQVRPVVQDGEVAHLVWVEQDVTSRRDTQQRLGMAITQAELLATALTQEKSLLTAVISAVPQLVYWKDAHGRYTGCNAAYLTFRGVEEGRLLRRTEAQLGAEDALGTALAELELQVKASGEAVVDSPLDLPDSQGRIRSLLLSVLPLDDATGSGRGVIGVGADITRARELEQQLAQTTRLESIGQLAAGIAHELNTPIQYVTDNVTFLTDSTAALLVALRQVAELVAHGGSPDLAAEIARVLDPLDLAFLSQEVPGALTESKEGLGRVTEIVRAMKEYAHPSVTRREVDVNRAVQSTVQVCRNEWKYVAQVELDLAPDVGLVPCYEGDLRQVVLNMIVNAAQAIEEDPRRQAGWTGTITVRTRRTPTELLITIRDDGPGMDGTVRKRVFDPFFTTKEVGKGTGQGLSLAHAVVVTKHHGRIDLETRPGQGACFTLHLPLVVEPETTPEQ